MPVAVSLRSVDDLVSFTFDHPDPGLDQESGGPDWYWQDYEIDASPERLLELVAAMLNDAGRLRERFSPSQLDRGLWFIFGPAGNEWFGGHLANEDVSWRVRREVFESIYVLYVDLLEEVDTGTAGFMLWDLLLDTFRYRDGREGDVPSDVRSAAFEVLGRLLERPVEASQHAALHGLGHLGDPQTPALVRAYLDRHPRLEASLRTYAESVIRDEQVL